MYCEEVGVLYQEIGRLAGLVGRGRFWVMLKGDWECGECGESGMLDIRDARWFLWGGEGVVMDG